ncbi:protein phosphatase 2C domain-containing protein [Streptomyces sp. NPDC046237]|uniref:protein phosphatase 2C domain-containing protein n=1 Tax=Streptomyces sp. NPDC046237 TaxID=3154914 RepID=UPI003400AFE4
MIVAGAAVQGTAHLARAQCCQDAFKAVDLGTAAVLAVADGAGGRERSALGAHIAVDAACRVLAENVPEAEDSPEAWSEWIAAAGARVVEDYRRAVEGALSAVTDPSEPVDTGALAATLAAAVVRPPWVAFLSIGDCFGTVLTREPDEPHPQDGLGRPGDREGSGRPDERAGPDGFDAPHEPSASGDSGEPVASGGSSAFGGSSASGDPLAIGDPGTSGDPLAAGDPSASGVAHTFGERCHLVLPPPPPGAPETVFLSSPGATLRLRSFALWEPRLSGVVLATDGCAPLTLDHPSLRELPPEAGPLPAERFFCGLAATLRANGGDAEPLRALLSGPDAARTGDDLTVICALTEGS